MNKFEQHKEELNRELKKLVSTLNEMLPRYSILLKKEDMTKEELEELGEIEHYLIGLNSKIAEIKDRLQEDLFGHTLDRYYKLKPAAASGDQEALAKLERLKNVFKEALDKGHIVNWN